MRNLNLQQFDSIQLYLLNNVEYLVLNKAACILVPKNVSFCVEKDNIRAVYDSSPSNVFWQRTLGKAGVPYAQRLTLRGLGERTYEQKAVGVLSLKLGYSHKVNINYDIQKIRIKTAKKKVVVACVNRAHLGNFLKVVQECKMPNDYVRIKKSGVWRRNQKKRLKIVKKK